MSARNLGVSDGRTDGPDGTEERRKKMFPICLRGGKDCDEARRGDGLADLVGRGRPRGNKRTLRHCSRK